MANEDVESGLFLGDADLREPGNTRPSGETSTTQSSLLFGSSHELAGGQGILRGITPPFVSSTPLQKFFNDHPQVREPLSREAGGSGAPFAGGTVGGDGGLSQRASSTSLGLSPRGSMTSPRREKTATFDLSAPPGLYLFEDIFRMINDTLFFQNSSESPRKKTEHQQ